MELTLGICDGHDAGACLVAGGRILAAVSEERLTGKKRQPGFPENSIRICLTLAGATPADVTRIAIAEVHGRGIHRRLDALYARTNPNQPMDRAGNLVSMRVQNFLAGKGSPAELDARLSRRTLRARCTRLGLLADLDMVDHHQAHALAAAATSGLARALVLTSDAFGDGLSATVSQWCDGELATLQTIPFPNSPALLFGMATAHLGFREGDEGKVAGLAATGDPTHTRPHFDAMFQESGDAPRFRHRPWGRRLRQTLAGFPPEDVAAGLQKCLESRLGAWARYWRERTGAECLCLAGGLFANVRLNQAVADACDCADLYVFPHMGDGGLCVGAALTATIGAVAFDPFVGPDIGSLPAVSGARVSLLDSAAVERLARAVLAGEAVGLCSGRLEFGPRALGNRSIVFAADRPELAAEINRVLRRPPIMPFAPVVREDDFAHFTAARAWRALDAMTCTVTARLGVRERWPVAVHADDSMRLQIARPSTTPLLYGILNAMAARGGPAPAINTSMNLHTEPIVVTAARALELFHALPLTKLVLGDRIVEK